MTNLWRRNERGVSLILVLVTLVIFGLIVPVLGQFGSANGVSGYVLKGNRFDRYAAEAGMQAAINWAEGQRQAGRQGTHCPDMTLGPLNSDLGPNASRTVTVQCAGFDGNGLPVATESIPQFALLALGTGQSILIDSSGKLRTNGPWWSNGSIDKGVSTIDASADYVGASGSCNGIEAAPTDCGTQPAKDDPKFLSEYPYPNLRVDPIRSRCEGIDGSGVVRIAPGLHWQADYFNSLADCPRLREIDLDRGSVPHLFDFTFYDGPEETWTIDPPAGRTVTVRNGTASGSDPASCGGNISPLLFADNFALRANEGASLELCGADENGQSIAAAQVPLERTVPTNEPSTPPNRVTVDGLSGVQPPQPPAWVGAVVGVDCVRNNGCPAGAFISGDVRGSEVAGQATFDVPDPVPDGAWLRRITIELSHREIEDHNGDLRRVRVWLTGLPAGYEAACGALTEDGHEIDDTNRWGTAREEQVRCDVESAQVPYFSTRDLQVHVAVDTNRARREGDQTITPEVTLGVDHVGLRTRYTPAGYRTSTARQVMDIENHAIVHGVGTVYLPRSGLNVSFGDATTSRFERGVIVSNVVVKHLGNDESFTPFSLPHGGNYTDRLTTFRAFLGTDTSDPTRTVLTARVRFCDAHLDGTEVPDVTPPCVGVEGSPAKILAWDPKS